MDKRRRDLRPIDPRAAIGRVRLDVADLDRSLAFYEGVLGFKATHRIGQSTVFLDAGDDARPQLALTADAARAASNASASNGACRFSIRYPDRDELADALRRLTDAGIAVDDATDLGVSEALYVRDPDGHGVELYADRPREEWPRDGDGALRSRAQPLDLEALRQIARQPRRAATDASGQPSLSEATRVRLGDMRLRLLNLHKVLLEDAKAAYEMDRGRVGSNASLLQLVINDPWFAWLHPLSGLVVRIDETLQPEAPATEADGAVLLEQVERLLSPATGAPNDAVFAQRYYDALQRQPAVIVAHAEVRRILKQTK